ncbi:MAG: hypothetical protein WBD71_01070 [Xanthobacteraceae bacterium]
MAEHNEAAWHAEFERLGELLVYDNVKQGAIYNNEASVTRPSVGLPSKQESDETEKDKLFGSLGGRFGQRLRPLALRSSALLWRFCIENAVAPTCAFLYTSLCL